MEYGVYIFFALVQLTAALFVYFLLPETAGVPIEMVSMHLAQYKVQEGSLRNGLRQTHRLFVKTHVCLKLPILHIVDCSM